MRTWRVNELSGHIRYSSFSFCLHLVASMCMYICMYVRVYYGNNISSIFLFRCRYAQTTDRHSQATMTRSRKVGGTETQSSLNLNGSIQPLRMNEFFTNCQWHCTILICCYLFSLLRFSFASLLLLPAWLQKHRASIDSSQIIMTSIHYSSSRCLLFVSSVSLSLSPLLSRSCTIFCVTVSCLIFVRCLSLSVCLFLFLV